MREIQASIWCRRRIFIPKRKARARLRTRIMPIRQPVSRRRTTTRKGAALCAEILAIGLRIVQIARTSTRNQQMLWLLVLMVERPGMVIYPYFFQYVIYLIRGLT